MENEKYYERKTEKNHKGCLIVLVAFLVSFIGCCIIAIITS